MRKSYRVTSTGLAELIRSGSESCLTRIGLLLRQVEDNVVSLLCMIKENEFAMAEIGVEFPQREGRGVKIP